MEGVGSHLSILIYTTHVAVWSLAGHVINSLSYLISLHCSIIIIITIISNIILISSPSYGPSIATALRH